MKGKSRTKAEMLFHDRLVNEIGCIACRIDGAPNFHCSIHHIDGRTKPGAHMRVLSLCAGHHQDGYGAPGLIAVHPFKARFEAQYGPQLELLEMCLQIIDEEAA